MDLSSFSDDEIVAEMQRRLSSGRVGWYGLLSIDQANHRDNWVALMETIHTAANRYPREFGPWLILCKARELVDRAGPQTRPFAINSTYLGVERPEEHQAQMRQAAE